jgi:hypothetical protein
MLNKPYIHNIVIKVMNNVRRQETTELPDNDMFIKMLIWIIIANDKASFAIGILNL